MKTRVALIDLTTAYDKVWIGLNNHFKEWRLVPKSKKIEVNLYNTIISQNILGWRWMALSATENTSEIPQENWEHERA